eukprot:scaffold12123_cov32-Tisochrysis_lutea.AAC.5
MSIPLHYIFEYAAKEGLLSLPAAGGLRVSCSVGPFVSVRPAGGRVTPRPVLPRPPAAPAAPQTTGGSALFSRRSEIVSS